MWKRELLLGLFLLISSTIWAQQDSLVFTYQEYLKNILQYHPVARKANLQLKLAEAEWLLAKGNLDPKLSSNWDEKKFDDKLYYRNYQGKLKIPTKLGINVIGGYENTNGVFLNPENTTDRFGLWNVGVEVNVLQGLIVNERKTALEQAKVFKNLAENEQNLILNELLYEASLAYFEWQKYYYSQEVLEENIQLADTYFQNTLTSYLNGEKTAMDTLEAFILYRDATNLSLKNETFLVKTRQHVENYLWFDDLPVALQISTFPEDYQSPIFQNPVDLDLLSLASNHPLILAKTNKLAYFEIEQKLKREKLKPKLNVKYNPLLSTSENSLSPGFSTSDFKWGFDFAMPLLLRKEKAVIQKGKIKLQEISLDISNKRNELQNKLESSRQQQAILQDQVDLLRQNVEGYKLLVEGESEKFRFGESSVFLLNKRQEKYINGRLKLIELYIKLQQELLNYYYYSNDLVN